MKKVSSDYFKVTQVVNDKSQELKPDVSDLVASIGEHSAVLLEYIL